MPDFRSLRTRLEALTASWIAQADELAGGEAARTLRECAEQVNLVLNGGTGGAEDPERPRKDDGLEVLGKETTACCLAHRRRVSWIPAPGWWIHSDHRSCMALWGAPAPIVLVRKDA